MKDIEFLHRVQWEITQLIRLHRQWNRQTAKWPSSSPKIHRLRQHIDRLTRQLQDLVAEL